MFNLRVNRKIRNIEESILGKKVNENAEIEFLRIYKDSIYHFNMLDRNVAYCLRYINRHNKENSSFDKWLKMTFDKKLKRLFNIAKERIHQKELNEFSERMETCRKWRNVVVHGEWDWKWWLNPPIHYHAPEPFNQKGSLSIKEFQNKLSYLNETAKFFREIRPVLEN